MELTKTTLCSLDTIYEEAQKFVNMEREMKSLKSSLTRPSNTPFSKKKRQKKPFINRH